MLFGQEARADIQQVYEKYMWLEDVCLFLSQWSQAGTSVEHLKGQPASVYEESLMMVHGWSERIHTVPSSVSTPNKLFIIHCTTLKETLRT